MKAILVIDEMPKSCKECPLKISDRLPSSCVFRRWHSLSANDTYKTNKWCPLKPMPNKIDQGYPCNTYDEGYGDGWDGCIDELLGEQK